MSRFYCVFDFETDGKDPATCNPVEIAMMMIDPYTLELVAGSEFSSKIKPKGIDSDDYFTTDRLETIAWHAKERNTTSEEIIKEWKSAPNLEVVWPMAAKHIDKYNRTQTQWNAPVPAGMNIRNFDLIISERLNQQFKIARMFNYEVADLRDLAYYWLQWDKSLTNRKLGTLAEYLGVAFPDAHTALGDVKVAGNIIARFLQLHKSLFPKIQFKADK